MKLTTIALASAFALSSTFALAKTVRHKPSVRTFDLHRGIPLGKSGFLHPNYGNPDGPTGVSAGGYLSNGRSASEAPFKALEPSVDANPILPERTPI
jgi:hypothetical protein